MTDWIPLFTASVWPLFLTVLVVLYRRSIQSVVDAVRDRVVAGAEFEAGASGVKLGPVPKLPNSHPSDVSSVSPDPAGAAPIHLLTPRSPDGDTTPPTPGTIYLVHTSRRERGSAASGTQYYLLRLYLDAEDPADLDDIQQAIYYLHETFTDPVRVVQERTTCFEVKTRVWGEFNVAVKILWKPDIKRAPLVLERYVNL
jgi:hypothetical protein